MNEYRTKPSWRRQPAWALCALITLGAVLDLSVKAFAREWLTLHVPVALLPGVNLQLGFNPGVAFGLFAVDSALALPAIVLAQAGLITFLLVVFIRTGSAVKYCYAAILSGAVANLGDRLTLGAVTDYINLYVGSWHWPTFNLADIFISLGVVGLMSHELIFDKSRTAVQE
jgi:signal peptidase II